METIHGLAGVEAVRQTRQALIGTGPEPRRATEPDAAPRGRPIVAARRALGRGLMAAGAALVGADDRGQGAPRQVGAGS